MYYRDLREYIDALEKNDKLVRFTMELSKDTEIAPLFWLQFRGLPEEEWKVLLFENVVDAKRRRYPPILFAIEAPNTEILALGLKCQPDEIVEKWNQAVAHPIEPEIVDSGPAHEVVRRGNELDRHGVDELAMPVESPGFCGMVRTTTQIFTRDPETGIRNVGTYSGQLVSKRHISLGINPAQQALMHLRKWRQMGKRMPVAIVVGVTPNIDLVGSTKLPYGVDELAVAGGLAGEPVKLVKCKTIDLEVPATAEIVIEGETYDAEVPIGAFCDAPGYHYEDEGAYRPLMEVTCLTHRRNPIFATNIAGFGKHSSHVLGEAALLRRLKEQGYDYVLDVGSPARYGPIVIQIKKANPWDPWQVLNTVTGFQAVGEKMVIIVDEDIDPRDPEAVFWALSESMQPHRDVRIITHRVPALDPSAFPPGSSQAERRFPQPVGASSMLIDATRPWPYTPVGLPPKEYMEQAIKTWERMELPALKLRKPWHGYHLGCWSEEKEEAAQLTVSGEHLKLGEKRLGGKRKPQAQSLGGPLPGTT